MALRRALSPASVVSSQHGTAQWGPHSAGVHPYPVRRLRVPQPSAPPLGQGAGVETSKRMLSDRGAGRAPTLPCLSPAVSPASRRVLNVLPFNRLGSRSSSGPPRRLKGSGIEDQISRWRQRLHVCGFHKAPLGAVVRSAGSRLCACGVASTPVAPTPVAHLAHWECGAESTTGADHSQPLLSAKSSPERRTSALKDPPASAGCPEAPPRGEEKAESPPPGSSDSATSSGCQPGSAARYRCAPPPPPASSPTSPGLAPPGF